MSSARITKADLFGQVTSLQEAAARDKARLTQLESRIAELEAMVEAQSREVAEAHEQQTATSEILRVISSSLSDLQPVMDTVAESAARLCEASDAQIFRLEGDTFHLAASHGPFPPARLVPVTRGSVAGRAVIDRQTVHVRDIATEPVAEFPDSLAKGSGWRTVLAEPLVRVGVPIGAIVIRRMEVRPFSNEQLALLRTFAAQAVIAIENARLFKELQASNRELTTALAQQTATAEILRTISTSPTDLQPVFETIAENAVRLCDAAVSGVLRFDGTLIHLAAHRNFSPAMRAIVPQDYPMVPTRRRMSGRAILDRTLVHVPDVLSDPDYPQEIAHSTGWRSFLSVPMLREGQAIGAVTVVRTQPGLFSARQIALLQTFADQAVIAIDNVRLFKELQEKNRALTEAHAQVSETLDQQTATSQILSVISRSQTDERPVFDTIVESVVQLCDGVSATVYRFDGNLIHLVAHHHSVTSAVREVFERVYPLPPSRASVVAQAILDRAVIHVLDFEDDPGIHSASREMARAVGHRSLVAVPMLRGEDPIGAISVGRRGPHGAIRPFSDSEITLLKTFAEQAVIAIENVRLFTELQEKNAALTQAHAHVTEALEQQTATSEILRVISSSPTDLQPVFDAIVASAVRLCSGVHGGMLQVESGLVYHVAEFGHDPEVVREIRSHYPRRLDDGDPGSAIEAIRGRQIIEVPDTETTPGVPEFVRAAARRLGFRSEVWIPMRHGDQALGAIVITRREPGRFPEKQVSLLRTFADQAVIAIENVRLFRELEARNRDLTESLEQQKATSEILRVISSSPTDVRPVFDAIVHGASVLLGGLDCIAVRFDGELMHLLARHNPRSGTLDPVAGLYPQRPTRATSIGRVILDKTVVHIPDVREDAEFDQRVGEVARLRSLLAVPMKRDHNVIGGISVSRPTAGSFSERQLALLQTFADQAVIAIENIRLFTELQASNRELTTALDTQTATSDILRVISRSQTDVQPVFDAIVASAVRLLGAYSGVVTRIAGDQIELAALTSTDDAGDAALRALFPQSLHSAVAHAQAMRDRAPINITDAQTDPRVPEAVRAQARARGYRSWVTVPLLRHEGAVGTISVTRRDPDGFTDDEIALLQTFADQAVIAIENVRLFKEIEEKSHQLEIASQHKSEFLVNMSHELRTPLNAIIGYSEMLQEEAQDRHQDAFIPDLEKINAAAKHQLSLINDILDLSKVEAGKMELELTDFHLPTAIDNALTLVRERAARRGIALQATVDPRLADVRADERKIKQVVLNLLSNAIKFTPEGGRIDVRALPVEGGVEVSVSDTGVGIAPEDQDAVFEEFRQVGASPGKQEGTGLGLTLCRKFVELHSGKIWVKSQVGAGSTFTFTIPARPGE